MLSYYCWLQLQRPEQVLIPERYDLDDVEDEQPLTEEEHQLKLEKSEKYRKMLAAHRLELSLTYNTYALYA